VLRQLQRLTRPVPALAPGATAIAIYAEAGSGSLEPRAAAESGFEGVACVDDAARAAFLYTRIWERARLPWARAAAAGHLRFLFAMQEPGGGFVNFILDWEGRKNRDGPTSHAGGPAWTARALHALARGAAALGSEECAARFQRGLACLDEPFPYLDVRAVAVLGALDAWGATADPRLAARAIAWSEEIAAARIGDLLPDAAGNADTHLWGHFQEAALARTGMAFGRMDLVEAARRSADVLLLPAAARAFRAPTVLPFDVSAPIAGLDAVHVATADPRYAAAASLARAWFDGRNQAGRPVYDRRRGLVHDGIDGERVNANSGAESNIEGALALFDTLDWRRLAPSGDRAPRAHRRTRGGTDVCTSDRPGTSQVTGARC
jgi:hypothetical protein